MSSAQTSNDTTDRRPLSVSELTERVKSLLEDSFPNVWVCGEISNFSRPQSGHCYLTLKDEQAQIRAVVWRGTAARLRFDLTDGLEVICRGHVDVYAPRGTYQLVVEAIEPRGVGALEMALRKLKAKLAAEGLFDPRRKRPLPRFPRRIAVVTSPTGAAIRDFLEVLRRRWLGVDVIVVPTRVQGDGAAQEIAAAIRLAEQLQPPVDVMVVGRGGGSLEDLWAFNEEAVVRAVASSGIPVISAVGHEIDVTLCDLAADVRALTPSEAAELAVPAAIDLRAQLDGRAERLRLILYGSLATYRSRLDALGASRSLRRPLDAIHELARRADEQAARAGRAVLQIGRTARSILDATAGKLDSLSPLAVLRRGYSITQRAADEQLVVDAGELRHGEQMFTTLARGRVVSSVERIEK